MSCTGGRSVGAAPDADVVALPRRFAGSPVSTTREPCRTAAPRICAGGRAAGTDPDRGCCATPPPTAGGVVAMTGSY